MIRCFPRSCSCSRNRLKRTGSTKLFQLRRTNSALAAWQSAIDLIGCSNFTAFQWFPSLSCPGFCTDWISLTYARFREVFHRQCYRANTNEPGEADIYMPTCANIGNETNRRVAAVISTSSSRLVQAMVVWLSPLRSSLRKPLLIPRLKARLHMRFLMRFCQ